MKKCDRECDVCGKLCTLGGVCGVYTMLGSLYPKGEDISIKIAFERARTSLLNFARCVPGLETSGLEDMPPALVNPKGSPNPIDDIKAADEKKLFVELCRKYLPELRINPDTGIADPGPACELAQDLDNLMEHYGCIFCVHVNLMFSESYDLNNSGGPYGLRV